MQIRYFSLRVDVKQIATTVSSQLNILAFQEHNISLGIMFPVKQEIYFVFEFGGKYEDYCKKHNKNSWQKKRKIMVKLREKMTKTRDMKIGPKR